MKRVSVDEVLSSLWQAAEYLRIKAFPTVEFKRISGPGRDVVKLTADGGFHKWEFQPDSTVFVEGALVLPENVGGVTIAGDVLEGSFFSLYAVDLIYNGKVVYQDHDPGVAAGPALVLITDKIIAGKSPEKSGVLGVKVHLPKNQVVDWMRLTLMTPGMRAAFDQLDCAWAQLKICQRLAQTKAEKVLVQKAAAAVGDLPYGADQPADSTVIQRQQKIKAFSKRLEDVTRLLLPFSEKIKALRVHIVGHAHIDMNWLWTWEDTVAVIRRDLKSVLKLMREFPELTFSHSQAATYEVFRKVEPQLFKELVQRIKEGRWEATSLAWVENDVNMTSGEAHIRQMLEGRNYTQEILGYTPNTYFAPDTFGHAGNLPQLIAGCGGKRYFHHRANPGSNTGGENRSVTGEPSRIWPAYWWEGQDGSRVLAYSTFVYNGDIHARDLVAAAERALDANHPCGLHFHGIGDHGGGPARFNLQLLRIMQKNPLLPTAFHSRHDAFTDEIINSGAKLPVKVGESETTYEGCYTSHADTKYYNRTGENMLQTADTLAALIGQDQNKKLSEAWRHILFHQFHDILDGSAIHEAYEQTKQEFLAAKAIADEVTTSALEVLTPVAAPGAIAITNPHAFEVSQWVVLPELTSPKENHTVWLQGSHGHRTAGQYTFGGGLGFVAKVPALATVSYQMDTQSKAKFPPALTLEPWFSPWNLDAKVMANAPYWRIETPHFAICIRKDNGVLCSFFDKRCNRQLIGYGMRHSADYTDTARPELALNVLQIFDEGPHGMGSWEMHEVHTEHSLTTGATLRVRESGPARCVLEVQHQIRQSRITQEISFYRDLPKVDFTTRVDWNEKGGFGIGTAGLKQSFTAHLPECEAWYETPFAAARRPADGLEVPALRWADVGGPSYGISVINNSKYGYDALGNRLRVTLVRSAYDPDPIADRGAHEISVSLVPHAGSWRYAGIVQQAAAFNQPLLARVITSTAKASQLVPFQPQLLGGGASHVILNGMKMAVQGGGRILRIYESAGQAAGVTLGKLPASAEVWLTDPLEKPLQALPVLDGEVQLTFRPWEVKTLLVK